MGKIPYILLLLIMLICPWTWRIYHVSIYGLVFTVLVTLTLLAVTYKPSKKLAMIFILLTSALILFQYQTTKTNPLAIVANDDKRVIDLRLRAYPPVYINIFNKTLWIPAAHWFEEKPTLLVWSRFSNNLFENLDLNQYFFAGHPKERLGGVDFEKLSYVLLPFTLLGWFTLVKKSVRIYWLYSFVSLCIFGFWGNQSTVGPVLLFPVLMVASFIGLQNLVAQYVPKKN